MLQSQSSNVRQWWRPALLFILIVLCINVVISFIHTKLYPSHCVRSSHVPLYIQHESRDVLDDPRQLYLHVDTPLLPLADKDVIVRSAYVNHPSSLRNGPAYVNYTVILLEVRRSLLDEEAFESCGVAGHTSFKFEVVRIGGSSSCKEGSRYTHTQALLYCHDVYAKHLDRAWVTYKKTIFGEVSSLRVMAERPILLRKSGNGKGSVVVCAAMLPHYTPFLEDWIQYQKTIGVDHVHLVLESLFLNQGRFDEEFLQTNVEQAYLSVEFWHRWLNSTDICDQSLDLALYSCALQFKESYSYVVFSDPRDFLVPRDSSLRPLLSNFLSRLCPDTHCQFGWKNIFYRRCEKAGSDGNITAVVPVTSSSHRDEPFIVFKLGLMRYRSEDKGVSVLDDSGGVKVPMEKGYFAHLGKYANSSNFRILPEHERC